MILKIERNLPFLSPSLEERGGMEVVAFLSKTGKLNRDTILSRDMDEELGLVAKYKNVFKEVQL